MRTIKKFLETMRSCEATENFSWLAKVVIVDFVFKDVEFVTTVTVSSLVTFLEQIRG